MQAAGKSPDCIGKTGGFQSVPGLLLAYPFIAHGDLFKNVAGDQGEILFYAAEEPG